MSKAILRRHVCSMPRVSLYQEIGNRQGLAYSLEALGNLALNADQAKCAAHLLSAAEALRKAIAMPQAPSERALYEKLVEASRAALGQESFDIAWSEGGALTVEQAIEYAQESPQGDRWT